MLDELTTRERYAVVGGAVLLAVVAFGAGMTVSGSSQGGDAVSEDQIRQTAQSIMDQQVQQQRQQLSLMANQSENISREDVSIQADVADVGQSQFGSLYAVTVAVSGTVPTQTGELQSQDQEQTLYISQDGRYLFSPPTDLQQASQQQSQGTPTQPQTRVQ